MVLQNTGVPSKEFLLKQHFIVSLWTIPMNTSIEKIHTDHQHQLSHLLSSASWFYASLIRVGLYEIDGSISICFLHDYFHYCVIKEKFESFWNTWYWIYRPTVSRKWYFNRNIWIVKLFPLPATLFFNSWSLRTLNLLLHHSELLKLMHILWHFPSSIILKT
jgi:hypothetical protein